MSPLRPLARLVAGALAGSLACSGGDSTTAATATASTSTSTSSGTSTTTAAESEGSAGTSTAATTTAASTGGASEASTTGASTSTTGGQGPFVLDVHTVLTGDGRLALTANLPAAVAACAALPARDPPCDDLDQDGLVDLWEDLVLERLRPLRRMDEEEQLLGDPEGVVADVGRVAPVGDRTRLFVMLGYSKDYGSCGGFTFHNGDSERVALDLAAYPEGGPGGVVVSAAYTAAHEGTVSDHGALYSGADLDTLVVDADPNTGEPRWVVFPSADKHATYATVAICEGISFIPCFDEDCAPDGVDDPAAFDLLPAKWGNAGEEAAPRLTDLSGLGFPGDDAWKDQDFCGGLGGSPCSSAVREKLLVDPFMP